MRMLSIVLVSCLALTGRSARVIIKAPADIALKTAAGALSPAPYRISVSTRAAFEQARQRAKPALVPDRRNVGEDRSGVRLGLDNGKTRVFPNKYVPQNEVADQEFSYGGRFPALGRYLVHGTYWEWNRSFLVDQQTGRVDTVWSTPVCSPDRKRLAALYAGWPMDGEVNGVQVYALVADRLKTLFTIDQQQWVPVNLAWSSNQALIIKAVSVAAALKRNGLLTQLPAQQYAYLQVTIH